MKKFVTAVVLSLAAVSSAQAQKTLNLFNWNDYIADETVTRFEQQCNCKVVQDYFPPPRK